MNTRPSIAALPPSDTIGELAIDICRAVPTLGPWQIPPTDAESADAYFARLIEENRLEQAARFVALRLGPRRAVWWGSLCAWDQLQTSESMPSAEALAAIDAAVAWTLAPSEENRQTAIAAAEAAGLTTPAGALATAAFWSRGSVSLPGRPAVEPPPDVAVKLAANAVLMAAASPVASVRRGRLMQSLRMAAEVLAGSAPWFAAEGEASNL